MGWPGRLCYSQKASQKVLEADRGCIAGREPEFARALLVEAGKCSRCDEDEGKDNRMSYSPPPSVAHGQDDGFSPEHATGDAGVEGQEARMALPRSWADIQQSHELDRRRKSKSCDRSGWGVEDMTEWSEEECRKRYQRLTRQRNLLRFHMVDNMGWEDPSEEGRTGTVRARSPSLEARTGPKRHAAMGGRMLPPPQRGAPRQVRGDDTWDAWAYPWAYDPRPHHRQPSRYEDLSNPQDPDGGWDEENPQDPDGGWDEENEQYGVESGDEEEAPAPQYDPARAMWSDSDPPTPTDGEDMAWHEAWVQGREECGREQKWIASTFIEFPEGSTIHIPIPKVPLPADVEFPKLEDPTVAPTPPVIPPPRKRMSQKELYLARQAAMLQHYASKVCRMQSQHIQSQQSFTCTLPHPFLSFGVFAPQPLCVCSFVCNCATLAVHRSKTHLKVKRISHMRKKLGNKRRWGKC